MNHSKLSLLTPRCVSTYVLESTVLYYQFVLINFVFYLRLKGNNSFIVCRVPEFTFSYGRALEIGFNPLNANPSKWSNTLKQFVGKLPTNCLSVFDHVVKLTLKGFKQNYLILLSGS